VLVVASIFAGKMMGYSWAYEGIVQDSIAELTSVDMDEHYAAVPEYVTVMRAEANELSLMTINDTNIVNFMRKHDYAEPDTRVTQSDINYFKTYEMPEILAFSEGDRGKYALEAAFEDTKPSITDLVFRGIDFYDLIFIAFGIFTTISVVRNESIA